MSGGPNPQASEITMVQTSAEPSLPEINTPLSNRHSARMDRARAWIAVLADVAVLAGIVFLALQVRQNTSALVAASGTALTDQSVAFFTAGLDNQVVAVALYKQSSGAELDGLETFQLVRLQYLNFRVFENAFLQYRRGYYELEEWDRYRTIIRRNLTENAMAQAMWEQFRGGGFTAAFEREVAVILESAN
jgi:hypothetical protein